MKPTRVVAIGVGVLSLVILTRAGAQPAGAPPRIYRDRVDPHWYADDAKFWYRNELPAGGSEFVIVDAQAATRKPYSDLADLIKALAAEGVRYEGSGGSPAATTTTTLPSADRERPSRRTGDATHITFTNHVAGPVTIYWIDSEGQRQKYATVPPGESWDSNTYDGHVWVVTDAAERILGVYEATRQPSSVIVDASAAAARRGERSATTAPTAATIQQARRRRGQGISPDGKWLAFVKDHNVYLRPTSGGEEVPLSTDGKSDDAYEPGRFWWSPDSLKLVALRTEPAQDHKVYEVESSPKDQLQPKLRTLDYLKPGDRIAHPRPQMFLVADHTHVPIKDDLFSNPWSVEDVRWSQDSARFTFVYNQRGHQVLRLIAVDSASGSASPLIDEHSDTFICYSGKYFCQWIGEDEILWMSERDGWNHLWLYDARTGQVKNQVTRGEWVVHKVDYVDEEKRQVWFEAGGVRAGQDPYYTHFCRADLDGTGFVVLTEGDGTHRVDWKPGRRWFIDTWSRIDLPPVTELRSSDDGKLVLKLEEADASKVFASRGGKWPQRFVAKGRDGETDIYGYILLPRDFNPDRKYPVLENIYSGPQGFFTPKAFRPAYGSAQRLADRGMVIVQCDGMGTSGRSKKFHDVCFKNLRDAGFPDHIAWIKAAAAAARPYMDLSRVGIYGGSAGGQNAMAALLWHNDFYKVAVADCGCHDNRMDKIWWNEQWMGWPVDKSYEENSNAVNARLLKGKLMLMYGELDSNVDPASTMQVVSALEKADKDFELVVVAGSNHGSAETPYGSKRRAEFLVRNLIGAEAQ